MNILLIGIVSVSTFKERNIPDDAIEAGITLLEKNGFSCEKDIFPKTYENLPSLSAEFYSATELSEMFFGTQIAFKTQDGSLIGTLDGATLTVTDNYFLYETEKNPVKASDLSLLKELKKLGLDGYLCKYSTIELYIQKDSDKSGASIYKEALSYSGDMIPIIDISVIFLGDNASKEKIVIFQFKDETLTSVSYINNEIYKQNLLN